MKVHLECPQRRPGVTACGRVVAEVYTTPDPDEVDCAGCKSTYTFTDYQAGWKAHQEKIA